MRIWIATGHTDMRKGMHGLALQVQESLGGDPFAGDAYVFRGRGGSLIKALWLTGSGYRFTRSISTAAALSGPKRWTVSWR
jgi:transposase